MSEITMTKKSSTHLHVTFIIIIIFPVHEAYVTRTRNSDLGRRSPGGGRVRCTYKKDTLGQVVAQFTMLIRYR